MHRSWKVMVVPSQLPLPLHSSPTSGSQIHTLLTLPRCPYQSKKVLVQCIFFLQEVFTNDLNSSKVLQYEHINYSLTVSYLTEFVEPWPIMYLFYPISCILHPTTPVTCVSNSLKSGRLWMHWVPSLLGSTECLFCYYKQKKYLLCLLLKTKVTQTGPECLDSYICGYSVSIIRNY